MGIFSGLKNLFGSRKHSAPGSSAAQMAPGSLVGVESPKMDDPVRAAKAFALNQAGMGHYYANDLQTARRLFEESLQIDPSFAEPYHHLAVLYMKLGQLTAAKMAMEQFLKYAKPDNPARQQVAGMFAMLSAMK